MILLRILGLYIILTLFYSLFEKILKILEKIERLLRPIGVVSSIEFQIMVDGQIRKVTHMFLKVSQKLPVSVVFKDKFGNAAQVDGKPAWAVTDPTLASLEVSDDGLSAVVVPPGKVGSFKVQVSADADLGEGVKTILGELAVDLVSGEAVAVEVTAGVPVDQA